jgi:molecular chaperone IbpA
MVITMPFGGLGLDIEKFFSTTSNTPAYPHYNIIQWTPERFSLEFAVAGFSKDQIDISAERSVLTVSGKQEDEAADINYLHKGISSRKFIRKFQLPEHVEIYEAKLENGILSIDLVKEIPEEAKPKKISIN